MSQTKARVLAARRFPPNVEARLTRDYDATLNPTDEIYSAEALAAAAEGHDALLVASSEKLTCWFTISDRTFRNGLASTTTHCSRSIRD